MDKRVSLVMLRCGPASISVVARKFMLYVVACVHVECVCCNDAARSYLKEFLDRRASQSNVYTNTAQRRAFVFKCVGCTTINTHNARVK